MSSLIMTIWHVCQKLDAVLAPMGNAGLVPLDFCLNAWVGAQFKYSLWVQIMLICPIFFAYTHLLVADIFPI